MSETNPPSIDADQGTPKPADTAATSETPAPASAPTIDPAPVTEVAAVPPDPAPAPTPADDESDAVADDEPRAELRSRVDVDAGEQEVRPCDRRSEERKPEALQAMCDAMQDDRLKAVVEEQELEQKDERTALPVLGEAGVVLPQTQASTSASSPASVRALTAHSRRSGSTPERAATSARGRAPSH